MSRRDARERALHLLYEAEVRNTTPPEVLEDLPLAPDEYAQRLVRGVHDNRERIDGLIAASARGWTLDRMAVLDRCVLRLATYELCVESDVPTAVALDEAVELAKTYSTEDSGRFVNGVLAAIARNVRP